MKNIFLIIALTFSTTLLLADIPPYDNTPFSIQSNFNYLPWVLGALCAVGILIFMYSYKKESKS